MHLIGHWRIRGQGEGGCAEWQGKREILTEPKNEQSNTLHPFLKIGQTKGHSPVLVYKGDTSTRNV